MATNEDIYKRIYTKTLERKNELSKFNNLKANVFSTEFIETTSYLDFSKSKRNLLPNNSSVIYLYEDVLDDKTLLDRKSIVQHTVYKLPDFISRTKVGILISDETGLIDPDIISVYVTDMNTLVFMINKNNSSYISVIYLKGIYAYTRYNNNVDVDIPATYKNSFVIWTKLDNSDSAAVDWIEPTLTNGQYKIPIRAQGKYSVLMLSDTFRFYNIVPQTNSQFSYINFPDEIGYTDLKNIFLWRNRVVGFSQPITHTPLYDGFKVEGVTRTSLTFDGNTGYGSFGAFPTYNDITIHLKVKINSFEDFDRILQRGNSDSYGWSIRTVNSNRIIFQFKKYDSSKNITSGTLTPGTWYDIVITARSDGSSPAMYIDSILQSGTLVNDEAGDSGTNHLVMGRRANESSYYASMEIDFVRIYNRVIVFGEILNAYNGIPSQTSMVNQWLINENTGTTITDSKGSNTGTLFGSATWNSGPDDTAGRLVGFSKRVNFTPKYTNLLHEYNKYKNYTSEYLTDTLPTFIKNYTPYIPGITLDTSISVYQDRMVTSYKDYPNYLKEYLEEIETIKFTDYTINDINPTYTRSSQATSLDGKYTVISNDTPRYVKNSDPMKKGIVIEEYVSNKVPDPLFQSPIVLSNSQNTTNWTIPYSTETNPSVQVSNGILRHTALNNNNTSIRLYTPHFTITKTSPLTVQFKIKYIKNTGVHQLYGDGSAADNLPSSEISLESYLYTSYLDSDDGFTYKEYRIPANIFQGSGSTLAIGLYGGWNTYEEKDYYIKEFQVTSKAYGGLKFTNTSKSEDKLKIPSLNVLNPTSGTIEIWYTPLMAHPTDNIRLLQTNDNNDTTRLLIYVQADGSMRFSIAGTNLSSKRVTSAANTIIPRNLYYIVMTWENQTLYAYINGVLIGTASVGLNANIADHFYLGADSTGSQQINSIIHDFRVSNIRRSTSDIQTANSAKTSLVIDSNTTMKMNFNETVKTPNTLMHPIKFITNHDIRKRLLFVNGLNISPESSTYDFGTKKWTSFFRLSDVKGSKITEVDTGASYAPYFEKKNITTQNIVVGPASNINKNFQFDVFEITPPSTIEPGTQGTLQLMDTSNYTYIIDENIIKFTFVPGKVGKDIFICERRYNQFISDGYSYDGLIQKLPIWISFLPKESMFIFLNGRLLERDRYHLFDPFRYTVVKGDTVLATDLDTNTIDGEIFNGYFTTELELVEYNVTLTDDAKIITLTNKDFPFSKKYNLVFVDGKLIHPDNIKEIDNFRFSITTNSINNMCVFRKRMEFTEQEKFSGIKDKWTEYLETLNTTQLESLIGTLNAVNTGENNTRSVYLTQRHLFEILYHYCLKGMDHLTNEDNLMIPIELPGTMLPDGRIPISTMRSGPYPRYLL